MSTDLDVTVRHLLQSKRGEWQAVASLSGVSHSWISQFVRGHIPNPGYRTLQKLAVALQADAGKAPATEIARAAEQTSAAPITAEVRDAA